MMILTSTKPVLVKRGEAQTTAFFWMKRVPLTEIPSNEHWMTSSSLNAGPVATMELPPKELP